MRYACDGLEESLLGSSAASLTSARPRLRTQGLTDSEPSTREVDSLKARNDNSSKELEPLKAENEVSQ